MLVIMQIILKVIILSSQKVHKVHDSIRFTKFSYSLVVQKMHDSLRLTNLSYSPIWFLTLLDLAELLRLRVKCFWNWFMFLQLGNLKDVKTLLMKLSFLKSKDFKDRKLNIRKLYSTHAENCWQGKLKDKFIFHVCIIISVSA